MEERKKDLEGEKEKKALITATSFKKKSDLIILPEPERLAILSGLQTNWEKLNTEYQKLPLVIDTLPKITR